MTLLAAEKLCKRFDDQIIFEQLSFTLQTGDKIGLVGKNGSGKTTLFEIITGEMEADTGNITKSKQCRIDYAEQEKEDHLDLTLFEFVASARPELKEMRAEIRELEDSLARNPEDSKAIEKLGQLHLEYEHQGGFSYDNEVKAILTGLGFFEERWADFVKQFSGGEKNRAGLARILAGNGNLLLLDEPTNHLDIESTHWLEEYLAKTTKAYIVVSHDRAFLQSSVTQVWELLRGRIDFYTGNFDSFLLQRSERKRLHEHHYRHQQERIKQLEDFVRRNMAGQKTKQAQSKLKYLSRIKRLPPPETESKGPMININSSGRSYQQVLSVEELTVGYGEVEVASKMHFNLYRGDKIGLIGANGSGKSTLIKTLIGELGPLSGDIKLGNNVEVAYFDQELSDLDNNRTVMENLWELDPTVESGVIRSFLGRFGFSGDDALKKVSTLSGGEKTKLSLARLLYHPANFIIFDEPTNHLDLVSREALEEALQEYEGSLLIVSHDRYFLNAVVTKIFYLNNGYLSIYDGNYSYFAEKNQPVETYQSSESSKSKENYLAFKEKSRERSRHKKKITATKEKIESLEFELEQLSKAIAEEIPQTDWEQLQTASKRKNSIEEELLVLYDQLEQLTSEKID